MRYLGTVVAAALLLVGCGSSADSANDPFAVAKAMLAETAYLPSYQRCVIREAEHLTSPAKIQALAQVPQNQMLEAATGVMAPATLKCKEAAGGAILDSHASSQELAPIKDQSARLLAAGAAEAGATSAQTRCIEQRFMAISDAEFIKFGNSASTQAQTKQAKQAVEPCLSE